MDWCPKLILCKLIKGRELALKQITSVYWTCKSNPGSIWILLLMESMGKKLRLFLTSPTFTRNKKKSNAFSIWTANLICILQHKGVKVSVTLLTQLSLRINWNIIHCKNKLQHVQANQFYSGREMREWEEQDCSFVCLLCVKHYRPVLS